jgi:hypothetical protein
VPYSKIILGPCYSVRLSDLRASDCVFARCMACGTAWRIAPHRLYDRFHPEERLKLIGDRMKCMRCHTGAGIVWHVLRASWDVRRAKEGGEHLEHEREDQLPDDGAEDRAD